MTDVWVAFVRARLAEREAPAKLERCGCLDANHWPPCTPQPWRDETLREVAALREVLTSVLRYEESIDGEWGDGHTAAELEAGECEDTAGRPDGVPLAGVRHLAAIWSDHPDYPGREHQTPQ